MSYSSKVGADQAAIDLTDFDPQPRSNGVEYSTRDIAVDGSVSEQGKHVVLIWDDALTIAEYVAILTQLGLNSATSVINTVNVPNEFYSETRYNGLAIRPEKGPDVQYQYFVKGVRIVIRDLEASA